MQPGYILPIEKIVPNPSKQSIEKFMQDVVKFSSYSLEQASSDTEFEKYFGGDVDGLRLVNTNLCECICENTKIHLRLMEGNTRTKIENAIIDSARALSKDKDITILSVGSGGLLQDLIIIFRLTLAGYRNININLVDPEWQTSGRFEFSERREQFNTIINAINQYCNYNITCNYYYTVDEIPEESRSFDIVYAIDYDDLDLIHDYSSRDLVGRNGDFQLHESEHKTTMALIKAYSYLNDELGSLAAFSKGEQANILSRDNNGLPSENNIQNLIYHPNQFEQYCVNASLSVLLHYLPFFCKQNKPVFINDEIMQPEERQYVEAMLQKFGINYQFFNYASCVNQNNNPFNNKLTLVIDGMIYDNRKNDSLDSPGFKHENICVFRQKFVSMMGMPEPLTHPNHLKVQLNATCKNVSDKFKSDLYNCIYAQGMEKGQAYLNRITTDLREYSQSINHELTLLNECDENSKVNIILNTSCMINRLTNFFADEKISLREYLTNLIKANDFNAISKAALIIFYLKSADFASVKQLLSTRRVWGDLGDSTGIKIWNALQAQQPDIMTVKRDPVEIFTVQTI